ncbi:hypothetical protein [Brevundimonas sp.]|uniref:hypothetical protein n=1 Tax=Brevundimonas sp. TaxID=1871086 RepID=UPI00263304ED|nr:hypothetical protein [Brevundimonas sp.]
MVSQALSRPSSRRRACGRDPFAGFGGWQLEDCGLDLAFRPSTYLTPMSIGQHALRTVKGAERRHLIASSMASEGAPIPDGWLEPSLPLDDVRILGSHHPSLLGGEFLPNRTQREVEIARITLDSTTQDVVSVYASQGRHRIRYRLVDEYGGGTLKGASQRSSIKPLSLAALAQFVFGGWDLALVLTLNFSGRNDTLEDALAFVEAESAYYDQFSTLVAKAIEAWWARDRAQGK